MFLLEVGFLVFQIDYMDVVSPEYMQAVLVKDWTLGDHIRCLQANVLPLFI